MADAPTGLLFPSESLRSGIRSHASGIAKLLKEREVQFLCGAGMSRPLGLPLSVDMARSFLADLFSVGASGKEEQDLLKKLASDYSLEAIAGAYLETKDQVRLDRLIAESVEKATGDIHKSQSHEALAYLANNDYIDRVYTTNYDLLIEGSLGQRACTITDQNVSSLRHELERNKKIPVIHLHGTPETRCLVTELETYQLDSPISEVLKADMVTHHFVMVGYRLADADLRAIYFQLQEKLKKGKHFRRPYVVHPLGRDGQDPVSPFETDLASDVWKARGALFVQATAGELLPAIVQSVRRLEVDEEAQKLAQKLGLDPRSEDAINEVWNRARSFGSDMHIADEVTALKMLAQRHGIDVRR